MAYPQDLANKFILYSIDPGGTLTGADARAMVNGLLPGKTRAANVVVQDQAMAGGANANPAWAFTFLKYVAGAVTTAPLTGGVLTGPMSGCYLCRYNESGRTCLAHIGTANAPDSEETKSVKTAWKNFVAQRTVTQVWCGTPFDYFTTAEITAAMANPSLMPCICGYFSGTDAFSLLLAPLPSAVRNTPATTLKVVSVKQMKLQPWSTIAAMRRFR